MKLTAINRVQGVKVLVGKGKGGNTAYANDVFEPKTTAEGERLVELGVAVEYKVHDPLADAEAEEGGKTKKTTTRKTATKKTGGQKAEDGSDTANDEDLGLGE